MNPIQPPPVRSTRRPGLTRLVPERQPVAGPPPLGTSQPMEFSDLEKVNRVGSGARGTVYKVVHRPTSKIYALKVIYGIHEENVRRQICRQIEILRDLDNPNVVKCFDTFYHSVEIQVLLEYLDGGSLEGKHISNESALAELSRQVLSGLLYLHRRQIVHRDIKPSNLLINGKGEVKIAYLGVTRIFTMDPNSIVGTMAYMSPERINTDLNQGQYDGYEGDIWSLGVSILEFYMGRFPFDVGGQGDCASLMCAIVQAAPPQAPPTASMEFRDFIGCCLQTEPVKRWTASNLLTHRFIVHNTAPSNVGQGGGSVRMSDTILNHFEFKHTS